MKLLAALVTLLALSIPSIVYSESSIELNWRDSGYDLAAGYRYSIGMVSHCVWTGACAKAAFSAGPIRAELSGSHLKVWINQEEVFNQEVGEEVTVYVIVDCDGSGTVEIMGFGNIGGFSIDHSYRIMIYTETVSAWPQSTTSSITISRQALNCWVTNPSLTPISETPVHDLDLSMLFMNAATNAATTAITIIFIGLGILLLIIAFSYAKRKKWIKIR